MNETGIRPAQAAVTEPCATSGHITSFNGAVRLTIISLIGAFMLLSLQSCASTGEIAEKTPGGICEKTYVRNISMDLDLGIYEAETEDPDGSVLKASPLYGTVRKTGSGFSYSPDCRGASCLKKLIYPYDSFLVYRPDRTCSEYHAWYYPDPLRFNEWQLTNYGVFEFTRTPPKRGTDINAAGAYIKGYTGSGEIIALADSGGTETGHSDLKDNILASCSDRSAPGDSHGTETAGIIAGVHGNGTGISGAAFGAKLCALTSGSLPPEEMLRRAAALPEKPSVMVATYVNSGIRADASKAEQLMRDPAARRILTVEPAGNGYRAGLEKSCPRDTDCVYPEKSTLILLPNAVSAASVNSEGRHPAYSSTGEHIWVSAPGGEYLGFNTPSIVTADLSGCERGLSVHGEIDPFMKNRARRFENGEDPLNLSCDYTASMNGTSAAAALTGASAAIVNEAYKKANGGAEAGPERLRYILARTARQLSGNGDFLSPPHEGGSAAGAGLAFRKETGFGLIDLGSAVKLAESCGSDPVCAKAGPAVRHELALSGTERSGEELVFKFSVPEDLRALLTDRIYILIRFREKGSLAGTSVSAGFTGESHVIKAAPTAVIWDPSSDGTMPAVISSDYLKHPGNELSVRLIGFSGAEPDVTVFLDTVY